MNLRKKNTLKNKKKFKKQQGGKVSMPIQFFGGQLNRYFPAGSEQLNSLSTSYGETVSQSHGTSHNSLSKLNMTAPNLAPSGMSSNGESLSSGIQTGGGKSVKNKLKQTSTQSECKKKGPAVCRSLKNCKYASGKKRNFCRKSKNSKKSANASWEGASLKRMKQI